MDIPKILPTIIIPIKKFYKFPGNDDCLFVGREKLKARMFDSFQSALSTGGSFLVGGYRGVGKTLLVDRIIKELKEKNKQYEIQEIKIDLGIDEDILQKHILSDIAESTNKYVTERLRRFIVVRALWFLVSLVGFFTFFCLYKYFPFLNFSWSRWYCGGIYILFSIVYLLDVLYVSNNFRIWRRVNRLVEAIRYRKSIEINAKSAFSKSEFSVKETKHVEPISTRRIQQELEAVFVFLSSHKILIRRKAIKIKYFPKNFGFVGKIPGYIYPKRVFFKQIVVFDEIDKINSTSADVDIDATKSRKLKVDQLLGGLKPLFNESKAIFVFVTGREMVDAFHSEAGYTSALYEGIFREVFYVPSLLSDHSDGQNFKLQSMISQIFDRLVLGEKESDDVHFDKIFDGVEDCLSNRCAVGDQEDKSDSIIYKSGDFFRYLEKVDKGEVSESDKEVRKFFIDSHKSNVKMIRRIFIRFLSLHSWGNSKRLNMLLLDFIEKDISSNRLLVDTVDEKSSSLEKCIIAGGEISSSSYYFIFRPEDIRRIIVSAKLFSLLDVGIARQLARTDDKLIVSSLLTMMDIIKFHSQGFNREKLDRTVAGIDIHAEANLTHITDDFVNSTYSSLIRRTRECVFQYRFYLLSDIEFSYLTKTTGARASSFEFSLDSADPIRAYYIKEIEAQSKNTEDNSPLTIARLQIILADIYFSERVYDKSYSYYTNAIFQLKKVLRTPNQEGWRREGGSSVEAQSILIEMLLKKGLLEELRENIKQAWDLYDEAESLSLIDFVTARKTHIYNLLPRLDKSKLGFYVHAQLAKAFLNKKFNKSYGNMDSSMMKYLETSINASGVVKGKDYNLFNKYLSLNYFGCDLDYFRVNGRSFYKQFLDRKKDGCEFGLNVHFYLFSHGALSSLANRIRGIIEGTSVEGKEIKGSGIDFWINIITELSGKLGFESELDHDRTKKILQSDIFNANSAVEIAEAIFVCYTVIYYTADRMAIRGAYSYAGQMYLSVILHWISLLEFIPWAILKPEERENTNNFIVAMEKRPKWLSKIVEHAERAGEKSNNGAFIRERDTIVNHDNSDVGGEHFPHEVQQILNRTAGYENKGSEYDNSTEANKGYGLTIWYRSNVCNYLLTFGLWETYCRRSIVFWSSKSPTLGQFRIEELSPPLGELPRVSALFMWVRARFQMLKFFKMYCRRNKDGNYHLNAEVFKQRGFNSENNENNEFETSYFNQDTLDEVIKELASVLESFFFALNESKMSSRSDDPDTYPPKSIIYFNIYEVISVLDNGFEKEASLENRDLVDLILPRVKEYLKGGKREIIISYLDKRFLSKLVERSADELKEILNPSSKAHRKKLRHKYYIYDDFEDPMFIAEWSYLMVLSAGTNLFKQRVQ